MLGNFSHNNVNSKIYFTISFKAFVFHISIVARPKTERLLCWQNRHKEKCWLFYDP